MSELVATEAVAPEPAGLLIDGAFRPSESGRTHTVLDRHRGVLGTVALASRRDVRDAVAAASAGGRRWAEVTADRRLAALLAVARELLGAAGPVAEQVAAAEDVPVRRAADLVDASIDRWLHHAGWADKTDYLGSAAVTLAGSHPCATVVRPLGVAAVLAPQASSLLGLVSVLAPVLATGNAAVVIASQDRPLPAVALAEVLAAADLPPGTVNVLTGRTAELAPWLAAHRDVDALDLTGAAPAQRGDLEQAAATAGTPVIDPGRGEPDWSRPPGVSRLRGLLGRSTVSRLS